MPPLKDARQERFAQLLASPHPPSKFAAYEAAGFKPNRGHAYRMSTYPHVAARITELQEAASRLQASIAARAEAKAVANIVISRQSLIEDTVAAYKLAESENNPQAMISAVRLLAELGQISLKAPEDKAPAAQHVHLHEMIDRPPQESLEQWLDRKKQEADARATSKTLKIVGKPLDS